MRLKIGRYSTGRVYKFLQTTFQPVPKDGLLTIR